MSLGQYRIGRLRPRDLLTAAHMIQGGGLQPVVPTYKTIVRTGRSRKRTVVTRQVLPGLFFILEEQAAEAQGHLSPVNMTITWIKDPANGGSYALCDRAAIEPLFEWAKTHFQQQERRETSAKEQGECFQLGQTVMITEGPLANFQGQITGFGPEYGYVKIDSRHTADLMVPVSMIKSIK